MGRARARASGGHSPGSGEERPASQAPPTSAHPVLTKKQKIIAAVVPPDLRHNVSPPLLLRIIFTARPAGQNLSRFLLGTRAPSLPRGYSATHWPRRSVRDETRAEHLSKSLYSDIEFNPAPRAIFTPSSLPSPHPTFSLPSPHSSPAVHTSMPEGWPPRLK